jgi:hypothetical protein
MGCNFPVPVYTLEGEHAYRPCGSCLGCRLEYSRQWAVRCFHESTMYKENSFLTLTFNNKNLPKDGSIQKSELQKFIKRFRQKIEPKKIRYFGCGEYGDPKKTFRPHYHLCVFGYTFPDLEPVRGQKTGYFQNKFKKQGNGKLYTSKMLEDLWKKGFVTVGDLTYESAGYVARYCVKKIKGKKEKEFYGKKEPPFALMSRMPGIGKAWLEKYMSDVYPKDYFHINGKKHSPPRFYDSILQRIDNEQYENLKKERRIKALDSDEKVATTLRGYHKEHHKECVTKRLERELHDE